MSGHYDSPIATHTHVKETKGSGRLGLIFLNPDVSQNPALLRGAFLYFQ